MGQVRLSSRSSSLSTVLASLLGALALADAARADWSVVATVPGTQEAALDVATDGSDLFMVGELDPPEPSHGTRDAYIERRSLATGALLDGAAIHAGSWDVASAVAVDSTGVYVVGSDGQKAAPSTDASWIVRKLNKTLDTTLFNADYNPGSLDVNNMFKDEAFDVAVDASGVYVVGRTGVTNVRVRKLHLSSGGEIWVRDLSTNSYAPDSASLAVADGRVYVATARVAPSSTNSQWTVTRLAASSGAVDTSFGSSGTVVLDPNPGAADDNDHPYGIAIGRDELGNATTIFVTGKGSLSNQDPFWMTYALCIDSGCFLWAHQGPSGSGRGAAVCGGAPVLAGFSISGSVFTARIERLDPLTGASATVLNGPASSSNSSIAVDQGVSYVVGALPVGSPPQWRAESHTNLGCTTTVPSRLVLRYSFDDPFNRGYDESGLGHQGVLGSVSVASGIQGKSLRFTVSNGGQELETAHAQDLDILGAMTGMAWVRVDGNHDNDPNPGCVEGTIFSKGGSSWFQLEHDNSGVLLQNNGNGDPDSMARVSFPGGPLLPGSWHHVAFVRSGDAHEVTFFLDGVEIGTGNIVDPVSSTVSPVSFGNYGFNGPHQCEFNGSIDEIKIFNTCMGADFIEAEYEQLAPIAVPSASRFGLLLLQACLVTIGVVAILAKRRS